ncbi:hypothetical protein BB560_003173 [Smittium megazygosporum]|uniref:Kinesin motor domain-containing protein n=1 Tax=Smittium megazygosporum TaxID=133381 RepID=A0A2T9ZCU4_9FUNG|nr:hypothetical protein BB560_003173 [Smittium megazygosporum]
MKDNTSFIVRICPLTENDSITNHDAEQSLVPWDVSGNSISQKFVDLRDNQNLTYTFDKVFDHQAKTIDIYNDTVTMIVDSTLDGVNGAITACGQTLNEKNHTMYGKKTEFGIAQLAIKRIFERADKATNRNFIVRLSHYEIEADKINNLLDLNKGLFQAPKDSKNMFFLGNPTENLIINEYQTEISLKLVNKQDKKESKSHDLLQVVIESYDYIDATSENEERPSNNNIRKLSRISETKESCLSFLVLAENEELGYISQVLKACKGKNKANESDTFESDPQKHPEIKLSAKPPRFEESYLFDTVWKSLVPGVNSAYIFLWFESDQGVMIKECESIKQDLEKAKNSGEKEESYKLLMIDECVEDCKVHTEQIDLKRVISSEEIDPLRDITKIKKSLPDELELKNNRIKHLENEVETLNRSTVSFKNELTEVTKFYTQTKINSKEKYDHLIEESNKKRFELKDQIKKTEKVLNQVTNQKNKFLRNGFALNDRVKFLESSMNLLTGNTMRTEADCLQSEDSVANPNFSDRFQNLETEFKTLTDFPFGNTKGLKTETSKYENKRKEESVLFEIDNIKEYLATLVEKNSNYKNIFRLNRAKNDKLEESLEEIQRELEEAKSKNCELLGNSNNSKRRKRVAFELNSTSNSKENGFMGYESINPNDTSQKELDFVADMEEVVNQKSKKTRKDSATSSQSAQKPILWASTKMPLKGILKKPKLEIQQKIRTKEKGIAEEESVKVRRRRRVELRQKILEMFEQQNSDEKLDASSKIIIETRISEHTANKDSKNEESLASTVIAQCSITVEQSKQQRADEQEVRIRKKRANVDQPTDEISAAVELIQKAKRKYTQSSEAEQSQILNLTLVLTSKSQRAAKVLQLFKLFEMRLTIKIIGIIENYKLLNLVNFKRSTGDEEGYKEMKE